MTLSWIVRNKLRGTLELHGFLPLGRPVRIPGGETFDLDSLPVGRELLQDSRQLQVAFREKYLETLECNDVPSEAPAEMPEATSVELLNWQADVQSQLNGQAHQLSQIGSLVESLVDKMASLTARPEGAGNTSLDAEALRSILRREHQNQVQNLTRVIRSGEQAEDVLTQREADNRARLIEGNLGTMSADISPDVEVQVTKVTSATQNDDNVDLLSNLGGFDD